MADELQPGTVPAASPSPGADSSPAVPATPAPEAAAPAPAPSPASETPSAAAAEPAPDAPIQPARSFLNELVDKSKESAPKPSEAPKPAEAKETASPAETPTEPVKPEPINWEYAVPETVEFAPGLQAKVDFNDEMRAKVNDIFGAFAANPRDKAAQQALVDFHMEQMAAQSKANADFNRNFWNETRRGWRDEWKSDPEIGGSGFETSRGVMQRAIDIAMRWHDESPANKAFQASFQNMLETTGVGDHPAFGKLAARWGRFHDEPSPPPPNVNPPHDSGRAPRRGRGRLNYSNMP